MSAAPVVTVPFVACSALLVAAGAVKIVRPGYTARALQEAGLPAHRHLVRYGAALEVVIGLTAILVPATLSGALVAVTYLAFAAFVGLALRRRWALSSCGCFGRADTAPTRLHLALDLGAALFASWWAASPPSGVRYLHDGPWSGVPALVLAAVVATVAYLIWNNPVPGIKSR